MENCRRSPPRALWTLEEPRAAQILHEIDRPLEQPGAEIYLGVSMPPTRALVSKQSIGFRHVAGVSRISFGSS